MFDFGKTRSKIVIELVENDKNGVESINTSWKT